MVLAVGLSPPFADVAGKKATWKRRSAPNVRYTHQPGWEISKTKITTSPHFLILHLSLVLCRWICKTIRLWAIMWHVTCIPPGSLFFRCVIWCVCDVFVMCYLMHIKCLFSHPLMGALGYSWGSFWETGEGEGLRCFTKSWKSKQDAH